MPSFAIVGVRRDGTECVLVETKTLEDAEEKAGQFRRYLEGYTAVRVERVGETALTERAG
jgi:hypothetical protein